MPETTTRQVEEAYGECYGCGADVPQWDAYCGECVAAQLAEQMSERESFDVYHRWADQASGIAS